VRLLLDEMISPAVARELRDRDHEVEAIERDRPELESLPDTEIVRRMAVERRGVLTNDIADFAPIHERIVAAGEEHYGMIFTHDSTLPRDRASIGVWVETLAGFLAAHRSDDALRNRVHHLG